MNPLSPLLSSYKNEAFHLETLSEYQIPGEQESFEEFQASGKLELTPDFKTYLKTQREKIIAGKRNIQVRIIPANTEYFLFQLKYTYTILAGYGFELNFVEYKEYQNLIEKHFSKYHVFADFWLFDKEQLVELRHNEQGKLLETAYITEAWKIREANTLRDMLIPTSQTMTYVLDTYLYTPEYATNKDEALEELAKILAEYILEQENKKK